MVALKSGKNTTFIHFLLFIVLFVGIAFSDPSWESGKTIKNLEWGVRSDGKKFIQILTTDMTFYTYNETDISNPSNNAEGMKSVLSILLTAKTAGLSDVSFHYNGTMSVTYNNITYPSRLIRGVSIGQR